MSDTRSTCCARFAAPFLFHFAREASRVIAFRVRAGAAGSPAARRAPIPRVQQRYDAVEGAGVAALPWSGASGSAGG